MTTLVAPAARDWAALPSDIVLDVFLRLGPLEVMLGAELACKPWRRVALEEPTLWRHVGFDKRDYSDERWRRSCHEFKENMWQVALDRAKGQCEAFKGSCHDDDLLHLVGSAPSLKSLNIDHYSDHGTGEYLVDALKVLTLLEELEIDFRYIIDWDEDMLQSVCKACPHLKKLVLMYASAIDHECNQDEFDMEPVDGPIPVMQKLSTLELYGCDLSCEGLKAILDSCPMLETLLIDGYFNKRKMDKELKLQCARVKNLTLDTMKKPPYGDYGSYVFGYSSEEDYSKISLQE
ncbi:hypothetical protein HU200_005076 [Digitaria exilis]|uniref:F-box domain-containing protein n=1 Tax=Digitaria exilis TaxID=1010633 RepID=A0A835KT02_9POAL|nr:hypothetical protein HU200_005076 [Digitaria exilis]